MRWPKKWIDAVERACTQKGGYRVLPNAEDALFLLKEIGALQDLPEPKEFYFCFKHSHPYSKHPRNFSDEECFKCENVIHVREVIDE